MSFESLLAKARAKKIEDDYARENEIRFRNGLTTLGSNNQPANYEALLEWLPTLEPFQEKPAEQSNG